MVCFQSILCGEASSKRLPGIIPAGYVSQTGYQYDSISRVAGHRELAPPSKFSKLGGFNKSVFITSGILHPQCSKSSCKAVVLTVLRPNTYTQAPSGAHPGRPLHLDNSLPDLVACAQLFLRMGSFLHRNAYYGI